MIIQKQYKFYAAHRNETLQQHMARTSETFRLKVMDGPTSVENLCHLLFSEITQMGFRLALPELIGNW